MRAIALPLSTADLPLRFVSDRYLRPAIASAR
jgi:hypothetical protein